MAESFENNQNDVLEKAVRHFIDAQLAGYDTDLDKFVKDYPGLEDQIMQRIHRLGEIDSLFASLMNGQDDEFGETIAGNELIGQRLGDFEILSLIGTGGMGAVFLAHQVSLDREVALKVTSDVGGIRGKSLERFKREAEVLAKTSHPNIVPIYEVGEQGPYSYFAMEYVHGVSLDRILASIRNASPDEKASDVIRKCTEAHANIYSGKSDDTEGSNGAEIDKDYIVTVSRMIISIAAALEYAHNKGILHRDVKPLNILVDSDGTAKLVDFGLAKAETKPSITVTGEFFGTASYVSPEQIRKPETADRRSDVYSLAATYYECLTLRPPFEGDTVNETLTRVISQEAVPPKKYCSRLSTDFNTVLLKALDKLPSERYPTASEFAAEIQRILDFKPITAKRPSLTRRAYKTLRRRPLRIALITVAVLVGVLGYWVISYQLESRTRRAAKELFDAARNRMTTNNYNEALELLGRSLSRKPDYVDAYLASAECQRFLGNYEDAVELCRKAISISDGNSLIYLQLGQALMGLKNWDKAKTAFQQAIDIDPDFALAHAGLAACYSYLGSDLKALDEFRHVITIDPNFPARWQIWFNIANILATSKEYKEAVKAYQEALTANPTSAEAHIGVGHCYVALLDYSLAEEAFKKAFAVAPRNALVHATLAQFYILSSRDLDAISAYSSAADICVKDKKTQEALAYYSQIMKIDPNNFSALDKSADCYFELGDYGEAIQLYSRAIEAISTDASLRGVTNYAGLTSVVYTKLGECYSKIGKNREAREAYLKALELNPDSHYTCVAFALHYWAKERRFNEAIQVYEKALKVEPRDFTVHFGLGMSHFGAQNYDKAIRSYELFLKTVEPSNKLVLMFLAEAYAECGDFEKAIERQKKVIELAGDNIKENTKDEYEKRLAAYKAKKPWRQ